MTAIQASIEVSPANEPGVVVVSVPGPQGIAGQNGANAAVYLWGDVPVGSREIGIAGALGFGIADPLFTAEQYAWIMTKLRNIEQAANTRLLDLEQKVSVLYDLYLREFGLRSSGVTIGGAGLINFGVGPAVSTGTPVGIGEQDYYPVHANSNSLM